jgi:hypothetical protein
MFVGLTFLLIALPTLYLALMRALKTDGLLPALLIVALAGGAIGPLLLGRLGLGIEQAFASRYTSFSALAPISVYFCLLAVMERVPTGRYWMGAMLMLLLIGNINSYYSGSINGWHERLRRTTCVHVVRNFRQRDPSKFTCTYPDPQRVLDGAPLLAEYHLSLFR